MPKKSAADNPSWTKDDFAKARPASEVLREQLGAKPAGKLLRQRGERGPQKAPTKQQVTMRLDRDVVEAFKADGPGWQSRINEVLRQQLR